MQLQKLSGKKAVQSNSSVMQVPPVSFYTLTATSIAGKTLSFDQLKGKYVLLVNTASECGYTPQYTALEKLHQQYGNKISVIGFPTNDFGGQEPGSDEQIVSFCQVNFGVTFPLMKKAAVTGNNMQSVFQWLTQPAQNGWNSQPPTWNFCKYLIGPDGQLLHFFPSAIDPLDNAITKYLS